MKHLLPEIVSVIALSTACGGSASDTRETGAGGASGADATVDAPQDRVSTDGFYIDSPEPDAPEDVTFIDGGNDCGLPPLEPKHKEVRTCCSGQICEGVCVLAPGASVPVCECAGISGGCVTGTVCCYFKQACTGPNGCTTGT